MDIWSNTDYPYQCLIDRARTLAFREAIRSTVRPGDTVLDAGAGSGILSFFAAEAGAARVYAVEVDEFLARILAMSADANGLGGVVEVIHGDVRRVTLPSPVDVCVMEMIETGLIDEMQAPALNSLRHRGIIGADTTLIPFRYDTFLELGRTNTEYYGYTVLVPKHDWPHYGRDGEGWEPSTFEPFGEPRLLESTSFEGYIDPRVRRRVVLRAKHGGVANAVRLTSRAYLTSDISLGATNALNGDKILSIADFPIAAGTEAPVDVAYEMGGGLASVHVETSTRRKDRQGRG